MRRSTSQQAYNTSLKMKEAFIYSFKVFAVTIIAGPILTGIYLVLSDPLIYKASDILTGMLYMVPAGIILCIPSWLLLAFLVKQATKKGLSTAVGKSFLSLFSVVLVTIPFAVVNYRTILNSNYWPSIIPFISAYAITLILCIWLFKVEPIKEKSTALPA